MEEPGAWVEHAFRRAGMQLVFNCHPDGRCAFFRAGGEGSAVRTHRSTAHQRQLPRLRNCAAPLGITT